MRFTIVFASLIASSFAVPAAINNKIDLSLPIDDTPNVQPHIMARQQLCDVVYCTMLFQGCVYSCESLSNGDW